MDYLPYVWSMAGGAIPVYIAMRVGMARMEEQMKSDRERNKERIDKLETELNVIRPKVHECINRGLVLDERVKNLEDKRVPRR